MTVLPHLNDQLSAAEIAAHGHDPTAGLPAASARNPSWRRCWSTNVALPGHDQRCILGHGHPTQQLHRSRAGVEWSDAEARDAMMAQHDPYLIARVPDDLSVVGAVEVAGSYLTGAYQALMASWIVPKIEARPEWIGPDNTILVGAISTPTVFAAAPPDRGPRQLSFASPDHARELAARLLAAADAVDERIRQAKYADEPDPFEAGA